MLFDIVGSLFSLLSTYYFVRLNNKAWLAGIIATCVNGWLYWSKGIYADASLEVLYFASMIYGWYKWSGTKKNTDSLLGSFSSLQWSILTLIFIILFASIFYSLLTFTHSKIALMDATTTSLSLLAQWLMCHNIIWTWCIWFVTDAIFGWMYLSKGLIFHSLLMMIYMVLAIVGYWNWRKKEKSGNNSLHIKERLSSAHLERKERQKILT